MTPFLFSGTHCATFRAVTFDTPKCCCDSLRRRQTTRYNPLLRTGLMRIRLRENTLPFYPFFKGWAHTKKIKPEFGLPQLHVFRLVVLFHFHSKKYHVSARALGIQTTFPALQNAKPFQKESGILTPFHWAKGTHKYFTHKCNAPRNPVSPVFTSFQLLTFPFFILVISKVNISAHYSRNTAPGRVPCLVLGIETARFLKRNFLRSRKSWHKYSELIYSCRPRFTELGHTTAKGT